MINRVFSSLNQKRRKPLRGKPFCYPEPFTTLFLSKLRFFIKYLNFDRSFLYMEIGIIECGIRCWNKLDRLASLWVMRHPCNQACFLAMNVISSSAVQLQSDGQSLLNQDHFIFFPLLSFNVLDFNILHFVLLLLFRECMHSYVCAQTHKEYTATYPSRSTVIPSLLNVMQAVWF